MRAFTGFIKRGMDFGAGREMLARDHHEIEIGGKAAGIVARDRDFLGHFRLEGDVASVS